MTKAALPHHAHGGTRQIVMPSSLTLRPQLSIRELLGGKVNTFAETLAHEDVEHGLQVLLAAPNALKTPLLNIEKGLAKRSVTRAPPWPVNFCRF